MTMATCAGVSAAWHLVKSFGRRYRYGLAQIGAAGTPFISGQISLTFSASTRPSNVLWLRNGDGDLMLVYLAG
jgi:hypothetical protein